MRFIQVLFASCLFTLAQLLTSAPAHAKWLRGETQNFIVYSSGNAQQLQDYAATLERFNALIRSNFGITSAPSSSKLIIYFLENATEVDQLLSGRRGNVAGFYSSDNEGSYAVANRQRAGSVLDLNGMTVLLHEYMHHFMFRNFNYAYPPWYVEGFAEYYSTAQFKLDGNWALGKAAQHRAYGLRSEARLPIEQILTSDLSKLNAEQLDLFYGRSWLLVHMLTEKPEFKGKLTAYFSAIQSSKTEAEAARSVFGDLRLLDRALNSYRDGKLTYHTSLQPIKADTAMRVTELDEVADKMVMLHLQRITHRSVDKTRKDLRALAAAQPARAEVWYELALSERDLPKGAPQADVDAADRRAEAALDSALAANPRYPRANVIKAYLLMDRLRAAGTTTAAPWTKARSYLVTANAAAVNDPMVLVAWYDSYPMQGRPPTKTARDALARAFELEPEITEVRIKYAFDLADQGEFDNAIRLVEFLARDPHRPEQGKAVLAQLTELKAAAAAAKK